MSIPNTNMRILKKTRRKPEQGDIFVFQLKQLPDRYYFGRVVSIDTKIGGFRDGGIILIYLYRTWSPDKLSIPALSTSELLIAPIGTNALPWTRGYFEVVATGQNNPTDLLPQHCFKDAFRGRFVDEFGNVLSNPVEPIGFDGLHSFITIDVEISKALSIPPAESN